MYPNEENMIVAPIRKRIKIITSIESCLISRMNFDYKEIGGKEAFLANPKHQYCASQWEEHDCSTYNRKNGDYYEHPILSHFSNGLWL